MLMPSSGRLRVAAPTTGKVAMGVGTSLNLWLRAEAAARLLSELYAWLHVREKCARLSQAH